MFTSMYSIICIGSSCFVIVCQGKLGVLLSFYDELVPENIFVWCTAKNSEQNSPVPLPCRRELFLVDNISLNTMYNHYVLVYATLWKHVQFDVLNVNFCDNLCWAVCVSNHYFLPQFSGGVTHWPCASAILVFAVSRSACCWSPPHMSWVVPNPLFCTWAMSLPQC